ncbi:MAG: UvrD-helicase domain-containing protein, partial [Acidobacteriaceae bacterium]|nr:UvrD-helicase domain-containing protein [Acidobacteriaceae bacterium]
MSGDCKQREQALDPSRSFIVEAPAGSGKTGLLAQRYLRLLSVVDRPESVVAMTFTRKAAAELRDRIYDALSNAQSDQGATNEYEQRTRTLAREVLAQDRKKTWNLLANNSRLQIQTIDALCAMLTRQMPVVSEFGGISEVVEEPMELYRIASRRTLRELAEGDEQSKDLFRAVSLHFDNDMASLESQMTRMLQKRDQWRFLDQGHEEPLIGAFCELLTRAHQQLREVFRQHAKVDFTEVTRAAIKALGDASEPTDLLYWLDYRIEHLLVDEFQDTSLAQYDLIKALTAEWSDGDGHTLFLVGDPMQSIYRFREAEVSLFLQCWKHERLGSVRLHPLRLTTNFRSTPEILDWIHQKFVSIMSEDDVLHGAVKLRESRADKAKSKIAPQVLRFIDDDGEKEARAIAGILEHAKNRSETAILVRSRSHITKILPALRDADIPYEAVEIDELKEQQHIIDLISLTRAILHVGDRVAWLACLRAPWCGLTLSDLSALAENERERTILDLLSDPKKIAALSSDGRNRAVRAQEILSAAVEQAGRIPLRELVEQTWMALGGPAILIEPSQNEDAGTYFSLLESFDQGGIIRDFSLLNQRLETLYARAAAGMDRVQVMTIHQAKGLEFDTVIVPQLGRGARSSDRDLLIWTEEIEEGETPRFLIAALPQKRKEDLDYKRVSDEIKKKDEHELKRLFYVACTRARNELYVCANAQTKSDGTQLKEASRGTFLRFIWPSEKPFFESELRGKVPVQGNLFSQQEQETRTRVLRRLPAPWRAPRLDSAVQWQPELKRATASSTPISYDWVSHTRRHVGTVVHDLLNRIGRESVAVWNRDRVTGLAPAVKSELLRLGVSRSEEPQATKQALRAVLNTMESERGRWILQAHADARSEWAISGSVQDKLISGTVDRLFRDEQGRLWIIDFKTGEHKGRLET